MQQPEIWSTCAGTRQDLVIHILLRRIWRSCRKVRLCPSSQLHIISCPRSAARGNGVDCEDIYFLRSVAVLVTCVQNGKNVEIGVVSLTTSYKCHMQPCTCHTGSSIDHLHALNVEGATLHVFLQGGLVQSGLILVAALLLWGFRTENEGYGFIH